MYFLYIATASFLGYSLYKVFKNNNIKTKEEKCKKLFFLEDVLYFTKEHECLDIIDFYTYHTELIKFNLNDIFKYRNLSAKEREENKDSKYTIDGYCIINYLYNDIPYKYIVNKESLDSINFPIYTQEQIKNYIYVNKIKKALIYIGSNNKIEKVDNEELEFDITYIIIEYLGPNYNFYKDLDIKTSIKQILDINEIKYEKDFKLKLYDNFNNEYIQTDYLSWNPNIR
jgi:hypothetical protein